MRWVKWSRSYELLRRVGWKDPVSKGIPYCLHTCTEFILKWIANKERLRYRREAHGMFYLCNLLTTQLMFTLFGRTLSFTSYKRCAMQTHPINARKHLILFALTRRAKIDGGETNKNSISSKQKKNSFRNSCNRFIVWETFFYTSSRCKWKSILNFRFFKL